MLQSYTLLSFCGFVTRIINNESVPLSVEELITRPYHYDYLSDSLFFDCTDYWIPQTQQFKPVFPVEMRTAAFTRNVIPSIICVAYVFQSTD